MYEFDISYIITKFKMMKKKIKEIKCQTQIGYLAFC